jgi:hypothetical protein
METAVKIEKRESMRRSVNRILAHTSPCLVFHAQRDLMRENIWLLRLLILPCAILAALFGFFMCDSAIGSIEIRYPRSTILGSSWLGWFFLISTVSVGLFWKR